MAQNSIGLKLLELVKGAVEAALVGGAVAVETVELFRGGFVFERVGGREQLVFELIDAAEVPGGAEEAFEDNLFDRALRTGFVSQTGFDLFELLALVDACIPADLVCSEWVVLG
jgi:hypothetical protein